MTNQETGYRLDKVTKNELRPHMLKIWKLNKKIANLEAERNESIDELNKWYGKYIIDKAYAEFETGVY